MNLRHPDQAKKPVILFLHGFMGSGNDWHAVVKNLAGNFTCLAPDLPGHGKNLKNHWPEGFLFPAWKEELIEYSRRQGVNACHVIGYSMGGRLALYLAIENPGFVQSLVLESASAGIADSRERHERLNDDIRMANQFETGPLPEMLDIWYDQPVFSGIKSHPEYRALFKRRLRNDPRQLAAVLRGTSTGLQPSLWQRLSLLTMPVLAIAGEKDLKYCLIVKQMQKCNFRINGKIIPGAGHNVHFYDSQLFTSSIKEFLSGDRRTDGIPKSFSAFI